MLGLIAESNALFTNRASMRTASMTFKDLISTISTENDIPAGTVRKVAKAVAESIKASVESGEDLLRIADWLADPATAVLQENIRLRGLKL